MNSEHAASLAGRSSPFRSWSFPANNGIWDASSVSHFVMGKQGVGLIPVRDLLCELTAFECPGDAAFEVPVGRAWRASYQGPRARRAMHDDAPGPRAWLFCLGGRAEKVL